MTSLFSTPKAPAAQKPVAPPTVKDTEPVRKSTVKRLANRGQGSTILTSALGSIDNNPQARRTLGSA